MEKVAHISTVHHPFDPRIYYKQCTTLKKNGFDVTLIITDHVDLKEKNEINIIKIKKNKNKFLRMIKGTINAYKEAKKLDAKVYHIHDPELLLVAKLLKNKRNIVIYDVHEDYETSIQQKKYIPSILRNTVAKIFRLIEQNISKDMEICIAEKYYREKFPNAFEILNYPLINEKETTEQKELRTFQQVNLLYTGNVTHDRGALIHSKLPSLIEGLNVTFVGKCNLKLSEEIHQHKGNEIVGIGKYVDKKEIDQYYRQDEWLAGLALFPPTDHYMKKELTKFFEYMHQGLPIICSNFPVWSEFIDKYKCGIAVDPYNEEEIKNAIIYLKNNPDKAREMGINGIRAVRSALNWNEEGKKLVNHYKRIISELEQ